MYTIPGERTRAPRILIFHIMYKITIYNVMLKILLNVCLGGNSGDNSIQLYIEEMRYL